LSPYRFPGRFDRVRDIDGRETEILICRHCSALVNSLAYQDPAARGIAAVQATDFNCDADPAEAHEEAIATAGWVVDYLENSSSSFDGKVFCDFGAGKGHAAISAARRGAKFSYACEMDTRNVERITSILSDPPSNLRIISTLSLADQPIDILFLWHALEHLPEPTAFWRDQLVGWQTTPRFSCKSRSTALLTSLGVTTSFTSKKASTPGPASPSEHDRSISRMTPATVFSGCSLALPEIQTLRHYHPPPRVG
jgi:hypothetical protein